MFKYVAGALAVACLWLYIQGQWKDMEILGLQADVANLTIERDIALANVATAEEKNEVQATQIDQFIVKVAQIDTERAAALAKVKYMEGLFNGHDFNKLLQAKPGLIENRMRAATVKVLKELEDASR